MELYEADNARWYATVVVPGGYVLLGPYDECLEAFHDARAYGINLKRLADGESWMMEVL